MKKYLMLIIGCFLAALSFNVFFAPYNIVNGGISGISLIVNKYIPINEGLFVLIVSLFLILISFLLLGFSKTVNCILGSILFSCFISLNEIILTYIPIIIDSTIISTIFGSILFGFGLGLVFKYGFSTGGTDIIAQLINKYFHISLGKSVLIIDGLIVLIGGIIFGFNTMLYAIIAVFIISVMIDKVILGLFHKKSFYIITKKENEVKDFINKELGHGVTVINVKGSYTNQEKALLLTVIPSSDYYRLKDGLKKIDEEAFFVVSDSYEVSGGI